MYILNLAKLISLPSSFRVVYAYLGGIVINQMLTGLLIGVVLITVILGLFFKSTLFSLLSVFPNILPIAVAFGVWALVFEKVSFMVAIGMGSTLGIVVDFTVHLLSKYNLARTDMKLGPEEAVIYAFETVGFALICITDADILLFLFKIEFRCNYPTQSKLSMVESSSRFNFLVFKNNYSNRNPT